MASKSDARNFDAALGGLFIPKLNEQAARIGEIAGLNDAEAAVIVEALRQCLLSTLHSKLSRLLLLELHGARVSGQLKGETTEQRWDYFIELAATDEFWPGLVTTYPELQWRVAAIVANRCSAAGELAHHWVRDRSRIADFLNASTVDLLSVAIGAGDSHRQGRTVVLLDTTAGRIVYKPRSLSVDHVLADLVEALRAELPTGSTIAVPRILDCGDHGWCEFVEHRYAKNEAELARFYQGIGHWLGLMRMLGGSDLHAENLIASGHSPFVVDCETLFTPKPPPNPIGYGLAYDRAVALVSESVLSVGLLPGRGAGLGWRGVDNSALGMLPDQQPRMTEPGIIGAGTDLARIGMVEVDVPQSQNLPSPSPELYRYWPQVMRGFDELTNCLRRWDEAGRLEPALESFYPCVIRVVPRATEVYAELGRMLWHPASLHETAPARERARQLLHRMAENVAAAPNDPAVIAGEIEDLCIGDIPFFTSRVDDGCLLGPGGTRWRSPENLAQTALRLWRQADIELERKVIRSSLVSAYINDGWMPDGELVPSSSWSAHDLERRRRAQALSIVREVMGQAITAEDGSASWIAPILGQTGWSVVPLEQDLYNGLGGIAVLLAAYAEEVRQGRADPVDGVAGVLDGVILSLDLTEQKIRRLQADGAKMRPPPIGGYIGLGSQLLTRLLLARLIPDAASHHLRMAQRIAEQIERSAEDDQLHDILTGAAGAIVPLLALARVDRQQRWIEHAHRIGRQLLARATISDNKACWTQSEQWPDGVGGFAHGVSGIAWALTRLLEVVDDDEIRRVVRAAWAFEDALYNDDLSNWIDLRHLDGAPTAAAWCHGSVGIGLAQLDLDATLCDSYRRRVVERAVDATLRQGFGWNHCVCHGDFGALELIQRASSAGISLGGQPAEALLARAISSLEEHGPCCGMAREAFVPGLLPGIGGIAYQLLRAHPDSRLPSILTPGGDLL